MRERVCVRGGGDLATGIIQKLVRAGFCVYVLECAQPTAIRRTVALSSAVKQGRYTVEDMTAIYMADASESAVTEVWNQNCVPIFIDPEATICKKIKPLAVVDAILAKRNIGTTHEMAPITIGLGPGFCAPRDVDAAIETMRGHDLGRLILEGSPAQNTGIPGVIGGKSIERVLRAPMAGNVRHHVRLGAWVKEGEPVFSIANQAVYAPFEGRVRGLLEEGMLVSRGFKVADIDPRDQGESVMYTISDKARCLGGAVLEAVFYLKQLKS